MTKSVTLEGLPRAGANSKPRHYKRNVQKLTDLPKTWVLRKRHFEGFRQKKNSNFICDLSKNPSGIQGPRKRQLNKAFVNSKKQNKQDSKKSIQIKTVGTLQD